jgi:predicted flap endonuclease-1-like 5' DNA nuclease
MADVVQEILFCLFLAAVLGVAIGWFARGLRAARLAAREAAEMRQSLEDVRAQLRGVEVARAEEQRRLAGLQAGAESARQEADVRQRELRETQAARDGARQDAAAARAEVLMLSSRLKAAQASSDAARGNSGATHAARSDTEARLAEAESGRDALRRELEHAKTAQPSSATSEATRQRLDTLRATLQAAEAGWDSARAQAETASQELRAARRQLAESESDREGLADRLVQAQSLLVELRSKLDVQPEATPLAAVEPTPTPEPERPAPPKGPTDGAHDDLQRIRGIGPVLERTLHGFGIYRYAQIASWTREDIHTMSERLPGFRNRIVRDRWTAAARRLHIAKYGSPP